MVVQKPLNIAPKRLQCMLLQLQKYCLEVKYKRGQHMYLADTLSQAFLPDATVSPVSQEFVDVDHSSTLALPPERVQQFQHVSVDDPVLQELRRTIQQGWPSTKSRVSEALHAYYDFRDELTVQNDLVFKGSLVVVPAALQREMMEACHATHIGIEGCIRRACESMYWPRMATELKEYMSKCDVCMTYRSAPGKEPIQQHELVPRPWARVGADLCDCHGRTLLVVCDYFSNYIEVDNLHSTTRVVSKALKVLFARYGVPDTLAMECRIHS